MQLTTYMLTTKVYILPSSETDLFEYNSTLLGASLVLPTHCTTLQLKDCGSLLCFYWKAIYHMAHSIIPKVQKHCPNAGTEGVVPSLPW